MWFEEKRFCNLLLRVKDRYLNSYEFAARAATRVGVASKEVKRGGADHAGMLLRVEENL